MIPDIQFRERGENRADSADSDDNAPFAVELARMRPAWSGVASRSNPPSPAHTPAAPCSSSSSSPAELRRRTRNGLLNGRWRNRIRNAEWLLPSHLGHQGDRRACATPKLGFGEGVAHQSPRWPSASSVARAEYLQGHPKRSTLAGVLPVCTSPGAHGAHNPDRGGYVAATSLAADYDYDRRRRTCGKTDVRTAMRGVTSRRHLRRRGSRSLTATTEHGPWGPPTLATPP